MNNELQEIKDLFEQIDQRIKQLEDKYKEDEEWPKEGDLYWFIDIRGGICDKRWENDLLDGDLFEIGNAFKTREDAEFRIEKIKVIQELKQMGRPFKVGDPNWMIQYDNEFKIFVTQSYEQKLVAYGDFYFDTKEELREAVEKIGEDRVKKYLFNVED